MENNFNLKKFLTENRATSLSKQLNEGRGDLEDIIEIIKSRSAETEFSEVAEAEEIIRAIKDYYGIENNLSEQENSSNEDFKRIEKWYYRSNPEADDLSLEQEEDGIKAHFEEWNSVKDQYKSIEQYFQDVERQGDWYPDKALSEQDEKVQLTKILRNFDTEYISVQKYNREVEDETFGESMPLATSYDSIEELFQEIEHFNSQAGRDEEIVAVKTSKGNYKV